jgi:dihydrofolate reductase
MSNDEEMYKRAEEARQQYQERLKAQQQRERDAFAAHMQEQSKILVAYHRAKERQQLLYAAKPIQRALIVAVDMHGGFTKGGEIPWYFPKDLKWFADHTKNQICVMGRVTYDSINAKLGEKAKESVLPERKCFVVSNTLTELPNATVIKTLSEVTQHLTDDELDKKTVFFIGGEKIYRESISLANIVFVTVINGVYQCDKYFPTDYLMEHFDTDKVYKHEDVPECRFTVWKRKPR